MEGIDGGLHPAVDGQILDEKGVKESSPKRLKSNRLLQAKSNAKNRLPGCDREIDRQKMKLALFERSFQLQGHELWTPYPEPCLPKCSTGPQRNLTNQLSSSLTRPGTELS